MAMMQNMLSLVHTAHSRYSQATATLALHMLVTELVKQQTTMYILAAKHSAAHRVSGESRPEVGGAVSNEDGDCCAVPL